MNRICVSKQHSFGSSCPSFFFKCQQLSNDVHLYMRVFLIFYLYLFIMKIWEKAGEVWECSQKPPHHPADHVLWASTDDHLFRCPLSARFEVLQSGMMSAKKSVSLVPLLCGHAKLFLLSACSANIFLENVFQKVRLTSLCGKERLTFFFKLENCFLFHYYSFKSSVFFSEVL